MPSIAPPAEGLREVYLDLHIHLGWAGEPGGGVKISAARDLTLANILRECRERKGIGMVGVIDAATTGALDDLNRLMAAGVVEELPGGGLSYEGDVTLIPGAEIEVAHEANGKAIHLLGFVRGARELKELSAWQASRVRNRHLSTQRHHGTTAADVVTFVGSLGGIVIPAHIFTPFKSALGAAASIAEVIPPELWTHVPAVELGLSSDTELADMLPELSHFAFVTDADAHSLGKIGREYNLLHVGAPTFDELVMALRERDGRKVAANYGLDPRLGKYHRTYCLTCDRRLEGEPPVLACPVHPDHKLVLGVLDRIYDYQMRQADVEAVERRRPPYVHQVPLQFVPGLGKKAMEKLLAAFGTEMGVLHRATAEELEAVVGPKLARLVVGAREGSLAIESGGGGIYGKV
ncbi:MAG TPA: endonuclease Q family protein, partial [Symbiobacteriaceae bacterium]|nr:endonuclease Q family protein [Symbiobacteriaceae bacterium]